MRRTRDEALATRARILDCAEKVFVETGVAQTTLADIAAAAGVTRGAIYGHFANKMDLYSAVISRVKQPMDELFEAPNDPMAADPIGMLHRAISTCLRDVAIDERTARVFAILLASDDGPDGPWRQHASETGAGVRRRFADALRNAVRRAQLPADLDVDRAAALIKATLAGVLREWLLDPVGIHLPGDASRLADALLDMLRFSPALRTSPAPAA